MKLGYMKSLLALLCLSVVTLHAQQNRRQILRVAAASDLQPALPTFAAAYEREHHVRLEVTFGSSSTLATQILNGAPFDVFLAADFSFPEKVVAAGLATQPKPIPYAQGTLVLWARKDSPIQPLSMERLIDPAVTRIAIADEFHAPYGRAAYAALRSIKLDQTLKSKLVVGENIVQTAQFVESGNAQMGFISLTLASSDHMKQTGEFVRVPAVYPKIRQCAVVIKKGKNADEGREFLTWLTSPKVQAELPRFGLEAVR